MKWVNIEGRVPSSMTVRMFRIFCHAIVGSVFCIGSLQRLEYITDVMAQTIKRCTRNCVTSTIHAPLISKHCQISFAWALKLNKALPKRPKTHKIRGSMRSLLHPESTYIHMALYPVTLIIMAATVWTTRLLPRNVITIGKTSYIPAFVWYLSLHLSYFLGARWNWFP